MALPYVPRSIQSGQWSNIVFYSKKIDMPETFSHKIPLNHQLRRQYRYAKWQHCKFLFTPYHEAFLVNYLIFKMISFAGFCRIKNFFFEAEKRGFDPFFTTFDERFQNGTNSFFYIFCSVVFVAGAEFPTKQRTSVKYCSKLYHYYFLDSVLLCSRFQLPMICVTFSEKSNVIHTPKSTMSYRSATPTG